jgi:hypothetical protein
VSDSVGYRWTTDPDRNILTLVGAVKPTTTGFLCLTPDGSFPEEGTYQLGDPTNGPLFEIVRLHTMEDETYFMRAERGIWGTLSLSHPNAVAMMPVKPTEGS